MTTTSSSMLALEDDARGGAVAVGELQRQAIHLVRPGLCVGEVQALDDDHAVAQEHMMRRCAGLLELLDREVVDPDHLDALIDEELGAVFADVGVVGVKAVVRVPERGIRCAQQDSQILAQAGGGQVLFRDPAAVWQVDDPRAADQQVDRHLVDAGAPIVEMQRRVHVRAAVRPHHQFRVVRRITVGNPVHRLHLEFGVSRVDGHPRRQQHADVEQTGRTGGHRPGILSERQVLLTPVVYGLMIHRLRSQLMRVAAVACFVVSMGTLGVAGQRPAPKDQKPDAAVQAQALAQQQEAQTLVRLADAAMSGQQAPAEFPIQFQNDFLRAQGSRVWVPITLTIDPAKLSSNALALYLRVVPRGMTAPPAAAAAPPVPDKNDKNSKDKDKDKKKPADKAAAPPPSGPNYPYEDLSMIDVKPAAGQPVRILRGIGVPAGSYDLYVVLHERAAAGPPPDARPKASVLKQPLDVPNYGAGEFSTSTVILAERVDQLTTPMTPEQQSEHPYAFGQTEIVVAPDHKFKKSQELIVLLQIYNPQLSP